MHLGRIAGQGCRSPLGYAARRTPLFLHTLLECAVRFRKDVRRNANKQQPVNSALTLGSGTKELTSSKNSLILPPFSSMCMPQPVTHPLSLIPQGECIDQAAPSAGF